ncbi:MAG: MATE family efflux transporter [Anaerobutyricum hallii]
MTELIKQKKQVPERLYSNKKLAALLIPLALDQLLNSFMGTIDTLVVSNLGSAAISAVSLVDSINILIVQAFFALASGGTVVCSHYLGCKSKDTVRRKRQGSLYLHNSDVISDNRSNLSLYLISRF